LQLRGCGVEIDALQQKVSLMATATPQWDTLIKNALVFDGAGAPPQQMDIAISDGKIECRGPALEGEAGQIIDAAGQWLMPGLLDIHTHLDLEVELDPGLSEVVRHGTTTALVGNCSLGMSFGKQLSGDQNPIVDCFTRVENIPKSVLNQCVEAVSWDNTGDYMKHFEQLPLGPNIAALLPHSMLRVEVMGLEDAISREPTEAEMSLMVVLLEQALDQGYVGLSTDGLPFHYLANAPHTDQRIPTQFASRTELKRLLQVLRDRDRVWQTTPFIDNKLMTLVNFAFTSGRLFGKPLKTSALAAVQFITMPKAVDGLLKFARLMNSKWFNGRIHFQALATTFRMWGDGVVNPIFEEMDSTCRLIAKEYEDREGRLALLNDPEFIEDFRRDWYHGRRGYNLAHLKARIGMPDINVIRDLKLMTFDGAPVAEWDGDTLQSVLDRLVQYQCGDASVARSAGEIEAFDAFPRPVGDDAEFMLHMLREYDKGFRWWVDVANKNPDKTLELLMDDSTLPGFNDSGAHLTNLSFFDANLVGLQLAQAKGLDTVAQLVKRLTREPAQFFGLDVGTLDPGAQADITLIDPEALKSYDSDAGRQLMYRDIFQHQQLVNRSDGVVSQVLIRGETVWAGAEATAALGSKSLGRALRAH
jgi:N-acyl-D-aspartate/D-glutamate deacylase